MEINQKYHLDIICLSETNQQDDSIRDVAAQLDFLFYVSVPPIGLSGGLVIYWKSHVQLQVLFQSSNLLDCKVQINGNSFYSSFLLFVIHVWLSQPKSSPSYLEKIRSRN